MLRSDSELSVRVDLVTPSFNTLFNFFDVRKKMGFNSFAFNGLGEFSQYCSESQK